MKKACKALLAIATLCVVSGCSIAGIIIFIWNGFVGLKISATGLIILIVGFYFLEYLEKEIAEEKLKNDQSLG